MKRQIAALLALASNLSCDQAEPVAPLVVPPDLPCDIREQACQEAILWATADVRSQGDAQVPQVRLISRAQLEQEYRRSFDSGEPDPVLDQWTNALRLLELLPEAQSFDDAFIESAVNNVAAYYSSVTKSITVIEDSAMSSEDGTYYLSHEFVHALQDQREGIWKLQEPALETTDATVAIDSLIEGEALWLSNVVVTRAFAQSEYDIDFESYTRDYLLDTLEAMAQTDAPLIEATSGLPYPVGGRIVARKDFAAGPAGTQALYADPSDTLAEFFDQAPPGLPQPISCEAPTAPDAYEAVDEDRMGIAGLTALWTRLGQDGAASAERALAWTGDALYLYASGTDPEEVALAWHVRLRSSASAQTLAQAVNEELEDVEAVARERQVLIAASTDPEVLSDWNGRLACTPTEKRRKQRKPSAMSRWLAKLPMGVRKL